MSIHGDCGVFGVIAPRPADVGQLGNLTGRDCCCDACFTGRYPTPVPTDIWRNRFEQKLSERLMHG